MFLLYFANITRNIEKENYTLRDQIDYIQDQININEVEYSLYNSYDYLKKLQKIYFEDKNLNKVYAVRRINYDDLKNKNLEYLHTVGIK